MPQATAELAPAPRILQNIIEPVRSSSEPAEPVRRKRASAEANRDQMALNLTAGTTGSAKETHLTVPEIIESGAAQDVFLGLFSDFPFDPFLV